jgi:outer membrane protein assembly factor BamB
LGTPQLPFGWAAYQDEQGQVYYCNEHSGVCQWEPPASEGGWIPVQDLQSGQTYYFNEQTGQTQWEVPAEGSQQSAALDAVALAEERVRQSVEYSPCNGPSMEALEALEAADEQLQNAYPE